MLPPLSGQPKSERKRIFAILSEREEWSHRGFKKGGWHDRF